MSAMDAKVLRRAAEIVEQGWCQGALARDERGVGVGLNSPRAAAWCAVGAFKLAMHELGCARIPCRSWDSAEAACGGSAVRFNNAPERTADEVAAALREAAARCEAE